MPPSVASLFRRQKYEGEEGQGGPHSRCNPVRGGVGERLCRSEEKSTNKFSD